MPPPPRPVSVGVRQVVLAYAVFAGLWILLSDRALGLMFSDPAMLVQAGMVKGWLFVAVTSLLLYGLVNRLARALAQGAERERALERERLQPPAMLMAIAEVLPDAIYAKDAEGRYVLANRATADIVSRPAEELIGRTAAEVLPDELARSVAAVDARVRETGRIEIREEVYDSPLGRRVFLSTRGPLLDPEGHAFGTFGVSRDITERQQAQQALQQLADDLGATLQAIPDLMFEVDAQGRYLKVKALNEALLTAPPQQLIGRTVRDALPPEAADTVMMALDGARRQGTDFGRTLRLPLPDGEGHFELSVARKAMVDDQDERFIVLSRDISARRAAESELRQRNQELERFNRSATERELRMVALKREVNALARAAGQPEPYDTSFADAP